MAHLMNTDGRYDILCYTDIGHGPCDNPVLFWIYEDGSIVKKDTVNGYEHHTSFEDASKIPALRDVIAHGRYCRRTERASLAVSVEHMDLSRGIVEAEFPDVTLIVRV